MTVKDKKASPFEKKKIPWKLIAIGAAIIGIIIYSFF